MELILEFIYFEIEPPRCSKEVSTTIELRIIQDEMNDHTQQETGYFIPPSST